MNDQNDRYLKFENCRGLESCRTIVRRCDDSKEDFLAYLFIMVFIPLFYRFEHSELNLDFLVLCYD